MFENFHLYNTAMLWVPKEKNSTNVVIHFIFYIYILYIIISFLKFRMKLHPSDM